jgi:enoyl-CoA hydratase
MTITVSVAEGIAVVTMQNPPVNALPVADTWTLLETFETLGADPDVAVIIITADGKGFNAGIDIREFQEQGDGGIGFILESGDACYKLFDAIYRTPKPVIAAVNGFCLGLGVGIVASCDILIATEKARFGLPEVDNGALGCASHLAKLVPPMKLRQMSLTCEPVFATELHAWGTVYKLAADADELLAVAQETAAALSEKKARVVSAAKAALNHIDVFDLAANYRMEQGYTYEMNLYGDGTKARNEFVQKERDVTR